jgi:hypothetical protein
MGLKVKRIGPRIDPRERSTEPARNSETREIYRLGSSAQEAPPLEVEIK